MDLQILQIKHQSDDQLISLLEKNIIGTPGQSMLYQHADVRKKVNGIPEPYFCNLTIREKLYGTVCFCGRTVQNQGSDHKAFYLRYFTFINEFRSSSKQTRRGRKNAIRKEVSKVMDGEGLDIDNDLLLYAYVDPENTRSGRLIEEFGFTEVGTFRTIPFSRFNPKYHSRVNKLDRSQLMEFSSELKHHYENYQLVSFENLFSRGNYFVIKEGEEIVCGVQGIFDQWKIIDLPGISGKFMMNIVPKIPLLGRLFNPNYKFVFLEGLYCKPGYDKYLNILFESVLAYYSAYSAILCLDPNAHFYPIVGKMHLGLTHKIMGEKEISIAVKSSETNLINSDAPFFISGFDVL